MSDQIQRETMEVDVLFVGGGCASLAGAIRLSQLIKKHNEELASGRKQGTAINEPMIAVIEKASQVGEHSLSGAVMNPIALRELIPDYKEKGCPIEVETNDDAAYFFGKKLAFRFPITPPPFRNKGKYLISIVKFNRWLGQQAESVGINIFTGFAGVECLYEGDRVVGVRTGDKGLNKDGSPKPNFEPGINLRAKVTVFGEGTRGSLFKQVAKKLGLRKGRNADTYEEGVKEIIQMPQGTVKAGKVIHTMGFPLKKSIGGTFIYTLPNDQIIVGLVGYLDTKDPLFDPHRELQRLKTHPWMRNLLKGGRVIAYGGKTLPAGGWYSVPKLYHDGMLVVGDSASFVDTQKLKGIHLGMKSGMCAAETILEAMIKNDFSAATLKSYEERINSSYVRKDLWRVRNFHQTLSKGFLRALFPLAIQEITGGRGLRDHLPMHEDDLKLTKTMRGVWKTDKIDRADMMLPKPDGVLFFDKLSSVYLTSTMHDEHAPSHLLIYDGSLCTNECYPKYKSPCNHFCPAHVYEVVAADPADPKGAGGGIGPDGSAASVAQDQKKKLQVNFTNCIHCKTCDIKCPFDNITWTPPEGGGGPKYTVV